MQQRQREKNIRQRERRDQMSDSGITGYRFNV
jgi:hypothetical protein